MKYFCVPLFQGFINVHSYMYARMTLQPCQHGLWADLAPLPACQMDVAPQCSFHLHAPNIGSYAAEPFVFLSLLNCLYRFILLWARKFTLLFCFWKLSDINDKVRMLNSAVGFILSASFFGMPCRRKGTQRFLYCFWVVRHFQIFPVFHDADEHMQHLQVAFVCFPFYHFPFWCTGNFSFNNT